MRRCAATSKTGLRCLNAPTYGRYCAKHKSEGTASNALALLAGGVAGAMAAPGLIPVAFGALAGKLAKDFFQHSPVKKKRVFVSFDFDNDQSLKHLIVGQTRHPGLEFNVIDHSLKEAAPEKDWEDKARRAIERSDLLLVVVGAQTHKAPGVLKEVKMAREAGTKIVQIIGYKDRVYIAVPNAGRLYSWSHENLKVLLA